MLKLLKFFKTLKIKTITYIRAFIIISFNHRLINAPSNKFLYLEIKSINLNVNILQFFNSIYFHLVKYLQLLTFRKGHYVNVKEKLQLLFSTIKPKYNHIIVKPTWYYRGDILEPKGSLTIYNYGKSFTPPGNFENIWLST